MQKFVVPHAISTVHGDLSSFEEQQGSHGSNRAAPNSPACNAVELNSPVPPQPHQTHLHGIHWGTQAPALIAPVQPARSHNRSALLVFLSLCLALVLLLLLLVLLFLVLLLLLILVLVLLLLTPPSSSSPSPSPSCW